MVIWFVPHCDFLFLNPAPELTIRMLTSGAILNRSIVLKYLSHVMEQIVYGQYGGGQSETILLAVQQNLCMGMILICRPGQPIDGLLLVLWYVLSLPVQFA